MGNTQGDLDLDGREGDEALEAVCNNINRTITVLTAEGKDFDFMINNVMQVIGFTIAGSSIVRSTWIPCKDKLTLNATYHDRHRQAAIDIHWTGPVGVRGSCLFSKRGEPLEGPLKGIESFDQHFVKNVTLSINIDGALTHFIETPPPVVCPTTVLSTVTQCCHENRRRKVRYNKYRREKCCHKDRQEKCCHKDHREKSYHEGRREKRRPKGCCEKHRPKGCCEKHRPKGCCEKHRQKGY